MGVLVILAAEHLVSLTDTFLQAGACLPAQAVDLAYIHHLAHRAVRLRGVLHEFAFVADHSGDGFRKFAYGQVGAGADVDQRTLRRRDQRVVSRIVERSEEHQRVRQIVHVQELALRFAAAPKYHLGRAGQFRFVHLAHQRGQDMGVVQVVVVARPVQIGRHRGQPLGAVLAVVRPAHLDTGDLRQRVRPVGGFQRAGEQVFFPYRLRAIARVDAGTAEKDQALDLRAMRRAADIGFDEQVAHQKIRRVGIVGKDAADFGCSQEHDFRPFLFEESLRGSGVFQIQLRMGARHKVGITLPLQLAHDRAACQAAMAGNINFACRRQGLRRWVHRCNPDPGSNMPFVGAGHAREHNGYRGHGPLLQVPDQEFCVRVSKVYSGRGFFSFVFLLYRVLEFQDSKVQLDRCFRILDLQIFVEDIGDQLAAFLHQRFLPGFILGHRQRFDVS